MTELQKYLKILSIDGSIRKINLGKSRDNENFILNVDATFNGIPFTFTLRHLTSEESEYLLYQNPIVLYVNGQYASSIRYFHYKIKSVRDSRNLDDLFIAYTPYELVKIIYDVVLSYFKETNKFKLLNTFY